MTLSYIPSDTNAEGILKAVASGVLPNGKAVIVNADGTVSVVAETSSSESQALGTAVVFETAESFDVTATYDENAQKVVVAYRANLNSNYGTASVGTVSGTTISFGTPVVFQSSNTEEFSSTYDSNSQKVVISYNNSSNSDGTAVVGTVSGTSISFGTPVVFDSSEVEFTSLSYDSNAQKVVISYRDNGNSNYGTAIVGTVSGTSISFGSAVVFESATVEAVSSAYDSNAQKIVISYRDDGNSNYGTAIVGTVSGTSISFGSASVFETGPTTGTSTTYDAVAQKVVIAYVDYNNGTKGTAVVATVSGTSISFGTPVVFQNSQIETSLSATYDANAQKVVIAYADGGNLDKGKLVVGTVSGTAISFGSSVLYEDGRTDDVAAVYDSSSGVERVVIAYRDTSNSNSGTAVVLRNAASYTTKNLTAENYIGMSSGPASPFGFGTSVVFETGAVDDIGSAYDSTNNRHVIAYQDEGNSNQGTAAVATVSGSTVSFGTPVVFETGSTSYVSPVFDSTNNKVVIFYIDAGNSGYLTAIVGTVSGTAISFGTAVVVDSTNSSYPHAVFDSTNGKIVCHYQSSNGYGIVGTVSGTSISFGTRVEINNGQSGYMDSTYDSNAGKVVASYRDQANSNNGNARVGTVSGTSISYGTEATFNSGNTEGRCSVFDPTTNKIAIFYKDAADSDKGKIVVGTVSGTNISFGSEVEVTTTGYMFTTNGAITVNSSGKLAMVYQDGGNSNYGTLRDGTISGTTVTLDTAQVYSEVNSQHNVISYNSTEDRMLVAYSDAGGNDQGVGQVYDVGFAGEVASGGAARIDIIGSLSTNQGGLTAGQSYFVQTDGTIGLTADDPSVFAGTAISATKLIVKT